MQYCAGRVAYSGGSSAGLAMSVLSKSALNRVPREEDSITTPHTNNLRKWLLRPGLAPNTTQDLEGTIENPARVKKPIDG